MNNDRQHVIEYLIQYGVDHHDAITFVTQLDDMMFNHYGPHHLYWQFMQSKGFEYAHCHYYSQNNMDEIEELAIENKRLVSCFSCRRQFLPKEVTSCITFITQYEFQARSALCPFCNEDTVLIIPKGSEKIYEKIVDSLYYTWINPITPHTYKRDVRYKATVI